MKSYIFKNKRLFIIFILLMLLYTIFSTLFAFVLSNILESAADGNTSKLLRASIFAVIFIIITELLQYSYGFVKYKLLMNSKVLLKKDLFSAIMSKNIVDYETSNSAAYINELVTNCNSMEDLYFKNILDTCYLTLSFISASIAAIIVQPLLLIIMVILSLATLVVTKWTGRRLEQASILYVESAKEYSIILKEYFSGFRLIKTFNLFHYIEKQHHVKNKNTEERKNISLNKMLLCICSGEFIGLQSTVIIMAIAALLSVKGIVTIGTVLLVGQLIGKIISPITSISDIVVNFKTVNPIRNNFIKLLSTQPSVEEGKIIEYFDKCINFHNVSFSYGQGRYAVKNINFEFIKNKKYAIVGESGSGKTTLLNLLLCYYSGYEGSICFDDNEIREVQIASLNKHIGIVSQETFLFDDTLKNNITLFHDGYSEDEIIKAIDRAGLTDFTNRLSMKLESRIIENGNNLSGGERQRISLARVLLKNYDLLLFDEFTSNLDVETAYRIEDYLLHLCDKTIITITHHLNSNLLKMYDEIIVMRNGSIIENGDFNTLFNNGGYFYDLYKITN